MLEFSRPLGDSVKLARGRLQLTQSELADAVGVDSRTVLNIENYKGNPKMEVLFPLIRTLKIDAREIFNPEMLRLTPALRQLRIMVEDCNEQEAEVMMSVFSSVLAVLRSNSSTSIK